MQIIIISGPSGSGKTSLRRRVVERYHLATLGKDDFKELLKRSGTARLGRSFPAVPKPGAA